MWSICRSHPRVGGKHNLCGALVPTDVHVYYRLYGTCELHSTWKQAHTQYYTPCCCEESVNTSKAHPRVGGKHNLCGALAASATVHVYYTAHENRHTNNSTHLAAAKKVLTLQKHTSMLAANITSVVLSSMLLLLLVSVWKTNLCVCVCITLNLKHITRHITVVHNLQFWRKCWTSHQMSKISTWRLLTHISRLLHISLTLCIILRSGTLHHCVVKS